MIAQLNVSRQAMDEVFRVLKKAAKPASDEIATLSHDGAHLSIDCGSIRVAVQAQGSWAGSVKIPAAYIINLARRPPKNDPLEFQVSDGFLRIGGVSYSCLWVPTKDEDPHRVSQPESTPESATIVGSPQPARLPAMSAPQPKRVDRAGLDRLIDNRIRESEMIDYQVYPDVTTEPDRDHRQPGQIYPVGRDVAAMANAGGGDIIFGVREDGDRDGRDSGVPLSVRGLAACEKVVNDVLAHCALVITPPISGLIVQCVELGSDQATVVIRVPGRTITPHAVTFFGQQFWIRRGTNYDLMTYEEIRQAFLDSAAVGTGG